MKNPKWSKDILLFLPITVCDAEDGAEDQNEKAKGLINKKHPWQEVKLEEEVWGVSIYLSQPRLEAMYLSGLESFSRPVLSLSFQDVPSSPVTSFVAFLWAFLRTLTSILCCGAQYCIQYSKRGRTSTKYKGRITSFDQMVMLCCGHSSKMHGLIWSKDFFYLWTLSFVAQFFHFISI